MLQPQVKAFSKKKETSSAVPLEAKHPQPLWLFEAIQQFNVAKRIPSTALLCILQNWTIPASTNSELLSTPMTAPACLARIWVHSCALFSSVIEAKWLRRKILSRARHQPATTMYTQSWQTQLLQNRSKKIWHNNEGKTRYAQADRLHHGGSGLPNLSLGQPTVAHCLIHKKNLVRITRKHPGQT